MRTHQSKAARKKYIQAFHASGMTQTQFARENGIKLGTFQSWLYKSRRAKAPATSSPCFVEVTAAAETPQVAKPEPVALRMRIGGDVVVEFATMPSPAYVVAIAQAAQRGVSC